MNSIESNLDVLEFVIDGISGTLNIVTSDKTFVFSIDNSVIGKMFHEIMRFVQ